MSINDYEERSKRALTHNVSVKMDAEHHIDGLAQAGHERSGDLGDSVSAYSSLKTHIASDAGYARGDYLTERTW